MKKEKNILWDTTEDSSKYPNEVKKVFNRVVLKERKNFTKWVGLIGSSFKNDIDWWASPPPSRHPQVSNLYFYICVLETLHLLRKKNILIKVDSKVFYNTLKKWTTKKNLNLQVIYKRKFTKLSNFLIFIKALVFHFFTFFWINLFTHKNEFKKDLVLIHTFATKDSITHERLFFGLDNYIKRKKIKNVFFVPSFIINRNIFELISIIKSLNKKNYLFKEHYLNLYDVIFAMLHFLRVNKFKKKYINYKKWDLSNVIYNEINSTKDYSSKIVCILNYRFSKNLCKNNFNIKKTISWFETQIDKGWSFGFRKFFPKLSTYGYQGFANLPQLMNTIPTSYEENSKVIPEKVITIGKAYLNLRKEFFPKLKIMIGPAFIYQDVFKKFVKKYEIEILVVLSGVNSSNKKLMDWVVNIANQKKNIRITIKPHKELRFSSAFNESNLPRNCSISYLKLTDLMKKTFIVIGSGPTSSILEALAYKCFLITPVFDIFDQINLKKLKIPQNKYSLVYNKDELLNKVEKLIKNKSFIKNKLNKNYKFKDFLFTKINEKNLRYFY